MQIERFKNPVYSSEKNEVLEKIPYTSCAQLVEWKDLHFRWRKIDDKNENKA